MRILLIDNHDSFTYNLADYFRQLGCTVLIYRNSATPQQLQSLAFDLLVLSPGPSVPSRAGQLMAIIHHFHLHKPILGICLGHQALIEYFGGSLHCIAPQHGVCDVITHDGQTLFAGLPPQVQVGRYHSWAAHTLPACMQVSATSADGTVMAIRHHTLPIEGLQFHPESILSMTGDAGMHMLRNAVHGRLGGTQQHYAALMHKLQTNEQLDEHTCEDLCGALPQLSADQLLVLVAALGLRLQSAEHLAAFTQYLQAQSPYAALAAHQAHAVDVCGTGGSGLPRINTSTLAALLLSGLGLPVLKHGNRAVSGRLGSFDLLQALDVQHPTSVAQYDTVVQNTQLAFLFAPQMHPVLAGLAPARKRMGIPSALNVMGPLLNPANPARQLIGTSFAHYMPLLRQAAVLLGKQQVYVVRGHDGLDEITLTGPTTVLAYTGGEYQDDHLSPADFGLPTYTLAQISTPTAPDAIAIARDIIDGQADGPHAQLVAANAGFAIQAFLQPTLSLAQCTTLARDAIRSGVLAAQLQRYQDAVANTTPQLATAQLAHA